MATYGKGDYVAAYKMLLPLAEQGNAKAQCTLGIMCYAGSGIFKDLDKAAQWYRLSAEQGYAEGQLRLGHMYSNGLGLQKDDDESSSYMC